MKADTVEERVEVGVGVGVDIGKVMERKLNISFPNLDDLNILVGTFDD